MSELAVTYRVDFWYDRHGKRRLAEGAANTRTPARSELPAPTTASKAARTLSLAHFIERLVDAGVVRDAAEVARRLGVSRARVSQIMALMNLSPDVQERILADVLQPGERELRSMSQRGSWLQQREVSEGIEGERL